MNIKDKEKSYSFSGQTGWRSHTPACSIQQSPANIYPLGIIAVRIVSLVGADFQTGVWQRQQWLYFACATSKCTTLLQVMWTLRRILWRSHGPMETCGYNKNSILGRSNHRTRVRLTKRQASLAIWTRIQTYMSKGTEKVSFHWAQPNWHASNGFTWKKGCGHCGQGACLDWCADSYRNCCTPNAERKSSFVGTEMASHVIIVFSWACKKFWSHDKYSSCRLFHLAPKEASATLALGAGTCFDEV